VQGAAPEPDADVAAQREVVDAFLAAAREGEFDALVAVLDPDVVLRADLGAAGGLIEVRGAEAVASRARSYAQVGLVTQPALINGLPGTVATREGRPYSITGMTIRGGRIAEIYILADPERLAQVDLTSLDD
jgi:hypothetical protein